MTQCVLLIINWTSRFRICPASELLGFSFPIRIVPANRNDHRIQVWVRGQTHIWDRNRFHSIQVHSVDESVTDIHPQGLYGGKYFCPGQFCLGQNHNGISQYMAINSLQKSTLLINASIRDFSSWDPSVSSLPCGGRICCNTWLDESQVNLKIALIP